jgi:two-component system, cell cycle sensor histidine kinase and response regulator CckA
MKTLLVLEDEPSVMRMLRHMLKEYGLIEATGAEQALRLFADHAHRIDLLLTDVTLPTSSGIRVALLLRSALPGLPVILMSGHLVNGWSDQDCADLQRLGSHLVTLVQKPFQVQVLLNAVCELIERPQCEKAGTE